MGRGHETAEDRFQKKVSKCWIFRGGLNNDGYGSFWGGDWVEGKKHQPKMVLAHRWAYEHYVEPIPEGMNVLHTCDVRACVRPDHLFLGTQQDNVIDMQKKKRGSSQSGEGNGNSRLSDEQVAEIRRRYIGTHGQQTALAREFGITQAYVSKLVGGRKMKASYASPSHRR